MFMNFIVFREHIYLVFREHYLVFREHYPTVFASAAGPLRFMNLKFRELYRVPQPQKLQTTSGPVRSLRSRINRGGSRRGS